MRLNHHQIEVIKKLLKDNYGLVYNDEQAQQAGLAIMRFVVAKELRAKTVEEPSIQAPDGV